MRIIIQCQPERFSPYFSRRVKTNAEMNLWKKKLIQNTYAR